jgi:hypothetical protein
MLQSPLPDTPGAGVERIAPSHGDTVLIGLQSSSKSKAADFARAAA